MKTIGLLGFRSSLKKKIGGGQQLLASPSNCKHGCGCFCASFQSQANHAEHDVEDPRAGEEPRLPAVGRAAGGEHDPIRQGAGRGLQLR